MASSSLQADALAIQKLAEAPTCFEVAGPDEELVEDPDCVVFFGAGTDARSCSVQRLRFERDSIEPTVARVRELIRARGRRHSTWEVLSSIHPPTTIDRLLSLGMQRSSPPLAAIMALSAEPPAADPDVLVAPVDTIADFQAHVRITHEVFGMLDRLPQELLRIERDGARRLADKSFIRYVARVDGVPAGAATATFTPAGVMLHTGSTLPRFRQRGVYRALVRHRWLEAVSHGTPHLVTRAGPMSRPILRNLGFQELAEVHFLVDSPHDQTTP
jgi:hypothetical protein